MSTFAARSWLYDDVCSVLDKHRVGLYSASSQKQQSICGRITQLGHIILILSCVISKEAANILLNPMILSTWNNQDNHYITESVVASVYIFIKHHKWTRIVVLLCLSQWLSEYYMWKAPFIHQTCIHIYSSGSDMCPHLLFLLYLVFILHIVYTHLLKLPVYHVQKYIFVLNEMYIIKTKHKSSVNK